MQKDINYTFYRKDRGDRTPNNNLDTGFYEKLL